MKGNKNIIERLNVLLADELTAINQYIIHSEMCENWGYKRLHDAVKARAIGEMKHAEKLIARILFLEGLPEVNLKEITVGATIEEQFKNDYAAEGGAVKLYNDSILLAVQNGDAGTAELLRTILLDEEKHMDWLGQQLEQIKQLQLSSYLVEQIG